MTWYLVAWVAWSCPGGWLGSLAVPAAARPLVCRAEPRYLVTANREHARRQVRAEGPSAALSRCRALRCTPQPVTWTTVAQFEED